MTAKQTDTSSLDNLVRALYETISADAGEPRDWDRQARLLHPEARLMRTVHEADGPTLVVMTADSYRANVEGQLAERGFHEREIGRTTQRFGAIAHVLSCYEARESPDSPEVERRGVNSFQCFHDGERWWLMNALWDNERPGEALPADWLAAED